jgi:hypothetical protein
MKATFFSLKVFIIITLFFSYCVPKPTTNTTSVPPSTKYYHPNQATQSLSLFKVLENENINNEENLRFDKDGWNDLKNEGIVKVELISVRLNDTSYVNSKFTVLKGIKPDRSIAESVLLPCPPYCPKREEITLREIKQEINQN